MGLEDGVEGGVLDLEDDTGSGGSGLASMPRGGVTAVVERMPRREISAQGVAPWDSGGPEALGREAGLSPGAAN